MVTCSYCGCSVSFFNSYKCADCRERYCGDCWKEFDYYFYNADYFYEEYGDIRFTSFLFYDGEWLCKNCWSEYEIGAFKRKYKNALKNFNNVKVYSKNYLGKLPLNISKKHDKVETEAFYKKSDALKSLQVIAHYYGYDIITDFHYEREEYMDSNNYIENYWIAKGRGGILQKLGESIKR